MFNPYRFTYPAIVRSLPVNQLQAITMVAVFAVPFEAQADYCDQQSHKDC